MPGDTSHPTANSQVNTRSIGVVAKLPSELKTSPAPLLQRNLAASRAGGGGEAREEVQRSPALINNSAGIHSGCLRARGSALPAPPPVLAGFTKKKKKLILCDDKLGSAFTVHTVPTKLAACQGQAVSQHDHNKHEPCAPVLEGNSILNPSPGGDQHP